MLLTCRVMFIAGCSKVVTKEKKEERPHNTILYWISLSVIDQYIHNKEYVQNHK